MLSIPYRSNTKRVQATHKKDEFNLYYGETHVKECERCKEPMYKKEPRKVCLACGTPYEENQIFTTASRYI